MADFKENINHKDADGVVMNGIATINMITSGPRKGGAMVRFEKDQSGFSGLFDPETGEVNAKAVEARAKGNGRVKLEDNPSTTASSNNYMTKDEVAAMLEAGHFEANDKGNYVGSLGATLRHSHENFGWIPDVSKEMTKGYGPTAQAASYDELMGRRTLSRQNAAALRAVEAGDTHIKLGIEKAAEAPAPAAGKNVEQVAAPQVDAKQTEASAELPF